MARADQLRFRRKLTTTVAAISSTAASHKAKREPTKRIVDPRACRQSSDRPETPKNCGRRADLAKKSHDRRRFPREGRQPHRGLRFPKSLRARSVAGKEFAILAIHGVVGRFAAHGPPRRSQVIVGRFSQADVGCFDRERSAPTGRPRRGLSRADGGRIRRSRWQPC
jgi:hypothetical protein